MDVERGAAWRRRQRRLRSWWRHEQQTVAAVLATVTHHSTRQGGHCVRRPKGPEENVTSTRVGPAEYFELSSDDGRPTGGERPAALLEPWPQGKTERHDGIAYELVLALDAPVLQTTVEQLPNVVQFFATQLPVVAETGYRSAEYIVSRCSSATVVSRHAAGGTAGGGADDRFLVFAAADYGAERGHSSSWWWRAKRWSTRFSSRTEFNIATCSSGTHF